VKLEGFDVPRETEARLGAFVDLLMRWNSRINLTAKRDERGIWQRHVHDSLQLAASLIACGNAPSGHLFLSDDQVLKIAASKEGFTCR
jgi:16S rRNA G527 N7-methylase RsmG